MMFSFAFTVYYKTLDTLNRVAIECILILFFNQVLSQFFGKISSDIFHYIYLLQLVKLLEISYVLVIV